MKLNNKGMSIIEIVLSFSMIMVMVVSMLTIVVNYRNKAQLSIEKLKMDTFKNTLTQDIQNDILKLGLKEINESGECETLTDLSSCINLVFNDADNTMKAFGVSKVSANDRESVEKKFLYYDGIKYKLNESLPDSIPEGRNYIDLQSIIVEDSNILKTDSAVLEDGTNVSLYSIDVNISHVDFKQDFGVHIVATTTNTSASTDISDDDKKYLKVDILSKNQIITTEPDLTTSSNNTSDVSGLYKSTATNDGSPTYYFRGNVKNNYVEFAGFTWRVVRINEDGTIRLVMQNDIGYSSYTSDNYGDYTFMYYSNGEDMILNRLLTWYNTKIIEAGYSDYVMEGNYYCEQAKVKAASNYTSGSATMTVYSNYTPSFKCEIDGNDYGIVNASVGLLNYDEVVYAGGYFGQANENYYLYNGCDVFWIMSPAGHDGTFPRIWTVVKDGSISTKTPVNPVRPRPVINLIASTTVTGTGTSTDPYVVK